jgi:hypothetical protein
VEGESSRGGFLLLLLGGRFELVFDDLEGSSVCFDDDLHFVSRSLMPECSLTYPVLDIAGSSTALPRRRVDLDGGGFGSCTTGRSGSVSTFCLLLRRVADGGLDSVDGSVRPESRWPAPFRFLFVEAEGI